MNSQYTVLSQNKHRGLLWLECLVALATLALLWPMPLFYYLTAKYKRQPAFIHDRQQNKPFILYFLNGPTRWRKFPQLLHVIRGNLRLFGANPNQNNTSHLPEGLISIAELSRKTGGKDLPTCQAEEAIWLSKQTVKSSIKALVKFCFLWVLLPTPPSNKFKRFRLLGITINNQDMPQAVTEICDNAQRKVKRRVGFLNADCVNIAYADQLYRSTLAGFDAVYADGVGVRMAASMIGISLSDNINGTDLLPLLCQQAASKKLSIYLLGAKPGVAARMQAVLTASYPNLHIAGHHHGYFEQPENHRVIAHINQCQPDILLVAFGAPKQEFWLNENHHKITVPVALTVGGLFDFYSGDIPRASTKLRGLGLEWAYRLYQEPKRLWKRYILGNPLFLFRIWRDQNTLRKEQLPTNQNEPLKIFTTPPSSWAQQTRRCWLITRLHGKKLVFIAGKRALDISISTTGMLLLSPLLLGIAIAIKLERKGPVLFNQSRIGLDGKPFTFWKFRTMVDQAELIKDKLHTQNEMADGVLFKMQRDPRVTRLGQYLRRYSLDELPQLWNVLVGDMALVGPRPALDNEVKEYNSTDRERLAVIPGITCTWQVSGRSLVPFKQQVEMDRMYIHQASLYNDLKLIIKTIPAVFGGKGAW